jgi:Polyketide cyclase / dehydrase and lipid transport
MRSMASRYAAIAAAAAVAVAAAGTAAWVAARPSSVRVERSARVRAPRAVVSARLADVRRWQGWPLPGGDPRELRLRFGGPAAGAGSSLYWSGDHDAGRLTVLVATDATVELEVERERPRAASTDVELRLREEGDSTLVTAAATWERDLAAKVLAVLGWPGAPAGSDLEATLASVAAAAEGERRVARHRVERAAAVDAEPDAVRAQLVDLRRWPAWSPWAGTGAGAHRSFGGAPSGAGASLYWRAAADAGEGRVTILAASPQRLEVELEATRGPVASKDLEIALAADGGRTRVVLAETFERDAADLAGVSAKDAEAAAAGELERALAGLAMAARTPR